MEALLWEMEANCLWSYFYLGQMYQTWEFHLCPGDKENLPVNQKVTMSHFRKGHFVFFPFSPIL